MARDPKTLTAKAIAVGALARARMAEIRQQRLAEKPVDGLSVFVVRAGDGFGWEIRQFGGLKVEHYVGPSFPTANAARSSGMLALGKRRAASKS